MSDHIPAIIKKIKKEQFSSLDLLPQQDLREKIVGLVLQGVPTGANSVAKDHLFDLRQSLLEKNVDNVKVVVFGGGTGMSNIIGGDSRLANWSWRPFNGLKEIFPQTRAIVSITDDGGSTGELLRDLPLIGIGDIRHVLLSSIQLINLQKLYNINRREATEVVAILADIFNWRFVGPLMAQHSELLSYTEKISNLPPPLGQYLRSIIDHLFDDLRLANTLKRNHCFGNLLLAAAIYKKIDRGLSNTDLACNQESVHLALKDAMANLAEVIGAGKRAVLPCTSTSARLRITYTNGVEISGEHTLGESKRGVPVQGVEVIYCDTIRIYEEVIGDIQEADIIIMAPGSLYSSIIPVFKVPGLADAVRDNRNALKILISNLWAQAGETDISIANLERKFHVSDMIRAYERNIPGGMKGLFNEVLCISLSDIPASILQGYAVEGKIPIYLDRAELIKKGYMPIECGVYSQDALMRRGVIQHDPVALALAIKGLYNGRNCLDDISEGSTAHVPSKSITTRYEPQRKREILPFKRFTRIKERLSTITVKIVGDGHIDAVGIREDVAELIWNHPVIPVSHLNYFTGIHCIDLEHWSRDQRWDNVFSFFDPKDRCIKIRGDQFLVREKFAVALLVALGESLLGDYAHKKFMEDVRVDQLFLGRAYHLFLREEEKWICYFTHKQLHRFLTLARMCPTDVKGHYTRLVNKKDNFTPPGLLMGLIYAWYIDNRLASHIEYKMSIMKIDRTDLIPEQLKTADRRKRMVDFFREVVFAEYDKRACSNNK